MSDCVQLSCYVRCLCFMFQIFMFGNIRVKYNMFSRFIPSLAVILAFVTTWVRHAGSGPLWKWFTTTTLVADCRKHWWRHLFFINNYLHDRNYCLVLTWYLATEVQVFLVCITAYILTRGRTRRVVLVGLLLVGTAAPALHTLLQDLDATIATPELFRTTVAATFTLQDMLGHNNLPCFVLGIFTGAGVYDWHKKRGHILKNNKGYGLMQYLALATLVLLLYSRSVFYSDGPRASLLARAAYSAAIRLLLGLTCILGTLTLYGVAPTSLKRFLEWRGWIVPNRLSYSMFLLHVILVHMARGFSRLITFSGLNMLIASVCLLLASYLVSVPFYMMVEAPFAALLNSFVKKRYLQINLQNKALKQE